VQAKGDAAASPFFRLEFSSDGDLLIPHAKQAGDTLASLHSSPLETCIMLTLRTAGLVLISSTLLLGASAQAQLLDAVKGAVGGGSSSTGSAASSSGGGLLGGLGGLGGAAGGAAMPSLSSVGTGNLTGVLTYCMQNKYVSGSEATSVQSQLMNKLGGQSKAQSDPGYKQGLSGILGGNSGQTMDLTGSGNSSNGGIKQQVTDAACEQVLKYGKSML
jgi:hypothetical protein